MKRICALILCVATIVHAEKASHYVQEHEIEKVCALLAESKPETAPIMLATEKIVCPLESNNNSILVTAKVLALVSAAAAIGYIASTQEKIKPFFLFTSLAAMYAFTMHPWFKDAEKHVGNSTDQLRIHTNADDTLMLNN